jgi:hypothetical protein
MGARVQKIDRERAPKTDLAKNDIVNISENLESRGVG